MIGLAEQKLAAGSWQQTVSMLTSGELPKTFRLEEPPNDRPTEEPNACYVLTADG